MGVKPEDPSRHDDASINWTTIRQYQSMTRQVFGSIKELVTNMRRGNMLTERNHVRSQQVMKYIISHLDFYI